MPAASQDDREYPEGLGNDARLMRWVKDNIPDPDVRPEGTAPVTMTGGELFDLLFQVTEWAYNNGTGDVRESPRRIAEFLTADPPSAPYAPKPWDPKPWDTQ